MMGLSPEIYTRTVNSETGEVRYQGSYNGSAFDQTVSFPAGQPGVLWFNPWSNSFYFVQGDLQTADDMAVEYVPGNV